MTWTNAVSMQDILTGIERVSRVHGYLEPRRSSFSVSQFDSAAERLGISIPIDLRAFLMWFDRNLWSWFMNPEQVRTSDYPGGVMTAKGEMITRNHPSDRVADFLTIHPPERWKIEIPEDPESELHWGFYKVDILDERMYSSAWSQAKFLRFGSSLWGESLLYCTAAPEGATGRIAAVITDNPVVIFLAESLAQWLAKLVVLDGNEVLLAVGELSDLPRRARKLVREDFRRLNPSSGWLE